MLKSLSWADSLSVDTDFLGSEAPSLYVTLQEDVDWDLRMKARKTASFGDAYNYSQITYPKVPMHPLLEAVAKGLEEETGWLANNCLLNLYEDGSSKMGYHADRVDNLAPGTGIAIVSLGSPRVLRFRKLPERQETRDVLLESGSLVVMGIDFQSQWQHAVPPVPEQRAPRISLTFRHVTGP